MIIDFQIKLTTVGFVMRLSIFFNKWFCWLMLFAAKEENDLSL